MVLVVAPGNGLAQLSAEGAFRVGVLVVAVEGNGGGVVVEFVEGHAEDTHQVLGHAQGQGGDGGIEEVIEAAAGAIVIERGDLLGGQAQEFGNVAACPCAYAVEGLAGQQDVLQQHEQGRRGGDACAGVCAGEVLAEELGEAQFLQDVVEERQRGDLTRRERSPVGAGDHAGAGPLLALGIVLGVGTVMLLGALHGSGSWHGWGTRGRRHLWRASVAACPTNRIVPEASVSGRQSIDV